MNDHLGIFTNMLSAGEQETGGTLVRNSSVDEQDSSESSIMQSRYATTERNQLGPSRFSEGMTTVDFLGIGGPRSGGLQEQQQIPVMGHFGRQHQQFSHGDSALEKQMWDV